MKILRNLGHFGDEWSKIQFFQSTSQCNLDSLGVVGVPICLGIIIPYSKLIIN